MTVVVYWWNIFKLLVLTGVMAVSFHYVFSHYEGWICKLRGHRPFECTEYKVRR